MRKMQFVPGEYYHICGRGTGKQELFLDMRDCARFLFLILYFQSSVTINNIGYIVSHFIKHKRFKISKKTELGILKNRGVELILFAIMDNHFHLVVCELRDGGVSQYMQKVLMAYAKYFNAKYKKSGHVFQGPFQAMHIEDNEQLLYTSAYVHRNPSELPGWKGKEHVYLWSSFQDYLGENRWGELLKTNIILEQFKNSAEYKKVVDESGAKDHNVPN